MQKITIQIQQATFKRLQHHTQPLVDTPESVIIRALDALDLLEVKQVPDEQSTEPEQLLDLSASDLLDLTHTKILDASIAGKPIAKRSWSFLRDEMLRHATKHASSFENLQRLFPVEPVRELHLVKGRKEDEGFHYLPEIDISVQGQSANMAYRTIKTVAQELGIPLNIGIIWLHKEAVAYPGKRVRIINRPSTYPDSSLSPGEGRPAGLLLIVNILQGG